jgi:hypothetical protein
MKTKIVIIALLMLVVFPAAMTNYLNGGRYKPSAQSVTLITNASVLRDVLPADVTNYVLSKLNRYNNTLEQPEHSYTIADNTVSRAAGSYVFNIKSSPDLPAIPVVVKVINYGGLLSITVTINGVVQDIS